MVKLEWMHGSILCSLSLRYFTLLNRSWWGLSYTVGSHYCLSFPEAVGSLGDIKCSMQLGIASLHKINGLPVIFDSPTGCPLFLQYLPLPWPYPAPWRKQSTQSTQLLGESRSLRRLRNLSAMKWRTGSEQCTKLQSRSKTRWGIMRLAFSSSRLQIPLEA